MGIKKSILLICGLSLIPYFYAAHAALNFGCITENSIIVNGNNSSILDSEFVRYLTENFKESFLRELKLARPPRISQSAKEAIIRQLSAAGKVNNPAGGGCQSANRRPVRQVTRHEPQLLERIIPATTTSTTSADDGNTPKQDPYPGRSYFNISNLQIRSVSTAWLNVHLLLTNFTEGTQAILRVYEYVNGTEVPSRDPIVINKTMVFPGEYAKLDVTSIVTKWVQFPALNFGVMVKAELIRSDNSQDGVNPSELKLNMTATVLHIHFRHELISRPWEVTTTSQAERPTNLCSEDSPSRGCCRYPLTIDLQSMGYIFVVVPQRITIYYCAGDCRFGQPASTRHAYLMQQFRTGSSSEAGGPTTRHPSGPCCVPTGYGQLPVLYMPNESSVKETTIAGVIANGCRCA